MDFAARIRGAVQVAIIRSSYPRHLEAALQKVKELNPQIKTLVIVMPRMADALKNNRLVDEVITLPQDFGTYPPNLDQEFTREMRQRMLPPFIILYNRANQCGYENVENLVMSFQPQEIWGMTADERFFLLSAGYRLKRTMKRLAWRLVFAPLIVPLIIILHCMAFFLRRASSP